MWSRGGVGCYCVAGYGGFSGVWGLCWLSGVCIVWWVVGSSVYDVGGGGNVLESFLSDTERISNMF